MPTLHWIGKDKVINHHQDVPYRILEKQYTYKDGQESDAPSENKIIHGDNLEALKSLLPEYEGKVKCIYIDPPYNTGNEGWVYNDNVNDPKLKKWLGQVVGKESEDLSRDDKWLCMMYPRLKLLHKLLAEDGAIFISIDDNEQANLRLICNEIFGINNMSADISWQRTYSPRNDSKGISQEVEHVLVYSKGNNWSPKKLPRTAKMNAVYKNPDNDIGLWRNSDAFAPGASTHQGMVYGIQHPFTGEMLYPYIGACWPYKQDEMLKQMQEWAEYVLEDIGDAKERAKVCGIEPKLVRTGVLSIVLNEPIDEAQKKAKDIYKRGKWPKFFFTNKGMGGIARKTYLSETKGKVVTNFWPYDEVGHSDEAKKILKLIFNNLNNFDTPKPVRLIERVLQISTDKNSIVLDSFAGSGTTAHAVLNLNKEDGGNRKFILIEMEDYAETITAERVKRVIKGYGEDKKPVEGTGGDFSYYVLGKPVFLDNEMLNEEIGKEKIEEYVWFSETKLPYQSQEENYLLGTKDQTAYYFYYNTSGITTLDESFLRTLKTKANQYIIYADNCLLTKELMQKYNIIFKKIPRDITKF